MYDVVIDARMLLSSGIGIYVSNLLPRIIRLCADLRFVVLGPAAVISLQPWAQEHHVRVLDCEAPIYSVSEQLELILKAAGRARLFWAPHYNIPLLWPSRMLVTVHDVNHLAMRHLITGRTKRLYASMMFRAVKCRADKIICVSRFTKNELMSLAGIEEEKAVVVHNGVDERWFVAVTSPLPPDIPYLLYVGNVKPHKNLVRLIQAFTILAHRIPHNLIIVGSKEGFITSDYAAVKAAEAMPDRIRFTGYVSETVLRTYFANATGFVFPSLYEGFGLPPLEAMAAGCPVAVSNRASLPEVCGDAAIYFDPYDVEDIAAAIELLVGNSALRQRLIEVGRERAAQFSWETAAAGTLAIIRACLQ